MVNRRAFKYMITGFILVLLDLHIFFDILPDPLGYILIASGIHQLATRRPNAKNAELTAYFLMVLSIPTLFLSAEVLNQMQDSNTGWLLYGISVTLVNLILMYFVFRMLILEVEYPFDSEEKQNSVRKMMSIYMTIALTSAFIQPFLINMKHDIQTTIAVIIIVLMLLVHIAFIFLLRNLQKSFPPVLGSGYPLERPN